VQYDWICISGIQIVSCFSCELCKVGGNAVFRARPAAEEGGSKQSKVRLTVYSLIRQKGNTIRINGDKQTRNTIQKSTNE